MPAPSTLSEGSNHPASLASPASREDPASAASREGSAPAPACDEPHAARGVGSRRVGALLALGALFVSVDILDDLASGTGAAHIALQVVVVLLGAPAALAVWRRGRREVSQLERDLSRTRLEAALWRHEARAALEGLSLAIDGQFDRWELTPAEREVGLLLLKGLSLKEVAGARGTSERTAREQARSVYRKSGLAGRAELAAFFLEDLLAPREPCRNTDTPAPRSLPALSE
jgi:DNA-binding CsgD family transcriptional regulator